jgi:uncharacterized protein
MPVRMVMDSNVLVSAIISTGPPRLLLTAARAGVFTLCSSDTLLSELQDVLSRDKFRARFDAASLTPAALVDDLRRLMLLTSPAIVPRVIQDDPDDDHVLAAAVACRATFIITGDKRHLLVLGRYNGIDIITARQACITLELA